MIFGYCRLSGKLSYEHLAGISMPAIFYRHINLFNTLKTGALPCYISGLQIHHNLPGDDNE